LASQPVRAKQLLHMECAPMMHPRCRMGESWGSSPKNRRRIVRKCIKLFGRWPDEVSLGILGSKTGGFGLSRAGEHTARQWNPCNLKHRTPLHAALGVI